jgi:hypothetical protein
VGVLGLIVGIHSVINDDCQMCKVVL